MKSNQSRTREGSLSDTHIARCDCDTCDGMGQLTGDHATLWGLFLECPACEGLGYLDISLEAHQAYEVYLSDLYQEVVRDMPARRAAEIQLNPVAA